MAVTRESFCRFKKLPSTYPIYLDQTATYASELKFMQGRASNTFTSAIQVTSNWTSFTDDGVPTD